MSAVKTIRRRFTVGRYRATLSVQLAAGVPAGVNVEWDRAHPPRLSSAELQRYRRLRNAILAGVAEEIGAGIAVFDLEEDGRLMPTVIQPEVRP
jgi:hypothetical protein